MSWLVDALVASALLMAAVLLVRAPVRRAFGPRVGYALWALPALRLLLPPIPTDWWRAPVSAPVTRAGELVILTIEPIARPSGPSLGTVLLLAWAIGALALIGFHLVRHHRFCARVLRVAEPVGRESGIEIVASAAAPGPVAFGLWRRIVAVPADFDVRWDADERALALAHELGHHARRDLHANWAALVVLALHWWNPLAWRALRAFRADQEMANDARVLAACPGAVRHAYGRAIVKAASPDAPALSAACHLHTISDLKRRLRMLTASPASRRRLAVGSAAVALLVAGGLGVTASSDAAERITQQLAAPLPPLAPAAPLPAQAAPAAPVATPPVPPKPVKSRKHVVVVKDGKTTTYDGAEADRYLAEHDLPVPPAVDGQPGQPRVIVRRFAIEEERDGKPRSWRTVDVPEISSMRCPGDATRPVTESSVKDGKRRIVICTNRIEAATRDAERLAMNGEIWKRNAVFSARSNLRLARSAIERDRNLSDDQRRQALAGIAQAEAELRPDARD